MKNIDFDKILKLLIVVGALFVGFLWSGGVWEYADLDGYPKRINKVTGTYEALDRDGKWKKLPF